MIPIRQTLFVHTNPKGRGNCMSACIASILELPIDKVIDTTSDEIRSALDWAQCIEDWLEEHDNLEMMMVIDPESPKLKGVYSIGCGPSPRGDFHHAVVCKNGVMVFDPHPSDDGCLSFKYHYVIYNKTFNWPFSEALNKEEQNDEAASS